ncbi:ABC transporter substrate-binding protein [Aliidongia dinghuensis]|uniref:ABC transporter substrate-binding protein n=1 Tax=Aliidongia dinghuensis TaxID=1867774 RepID=A0A8J2YWE5_9PROT|nr:TRAP transporter substrate-binding protein [Aliidongia dinghuensis]GGF27651.1 ABC transporter substrate-binding protein [Aliidongia dinghuensis]
MPGITRRRFVGTAAAVGLGATLLPKGLRAAEFSYKMANNLAVSHPMNTRLKEAADRIREGSGGKLDIQIFPNSQLGGDTDMLSQVRSGALEFFTLSGLILSTLVPIASINGIGFAFKNYDQVWKSMDGDLGAYVRQAIAKVGLVAFDKMWDNGYREITSASKPILKPEDLAGFKIRVPVSPLWTSMFKAFGSAPASINFSEVYSALQTKIVEGQENPLAIIESGKLYEVQKYCSMTNHMWDGFHFLANAEAFKALPKNLQDLVQENFNKSAVDERADVAKLNASLREELTGKGLTFADPDPEPFRAALKKAGFYAEWKQKYGEEAWALLEKNVGSLA